jgi:hypothetical protein
MCQSHIFQVKNNFRNSPQKDIVIENSCNLWSVPSYLLKKRLYLVRTLHAIFNPQIEEAHQNHGLTLTTFFKWTISRLDKLCPNLPNSPSSGVGRAILVWVPICLPPFVPWERHFVALGKGRIFNSCSSCRSWFNPI